MIKLMCIINLKDVKNLIYMLLLIYEGSVLLCYIAENVC